MYSMLLIASLLGLIVDATTSVSTREVVKTTTPVAIGDQSGPSSGTTASPGKYDDKKVIHFHTPVLEFPAEWVGQCNGSIRMVRHTNVTKRWSFHIHCHVKNGSVWKLSTYREWAERSKWLMNIQYLDRADKERRVALDLDCSPGGSVSLPWPYRAKFLWYVKVRFCQIHDDLTEYHVQSFPDPDILGGIDFADGVMVTRLRDMFASMKMASYLSKDIKCFPQYLEAYTKRNVSNLITELDYVEPENSSISEMIAKYNQDNFMNEHQCNYKLLRYIDKSHSSSLARHHLHFLTSNARFPALEYFNISHSRISDMGIHVLGWRIHFPEMRYFDLSYNKIDSFSGLTDSGLANTTIGVIDLSHNKFTKLDPLELQALRVHTRTVRLNLHHNPWTCDCDMRELVNFLHEVNITTNPERFSGLMDLTCKDPPILADRLISDIAIADLGCTVEKTLFLVAPFIALGCVVFVLSVAVVFLFRYRKHIVILAFTRLNIILPCQKIEKPMNKTYDAFVAYSSAEFDTEWVVKTLVPRLELPDLGAGFRLCLHHRDFAVGAAIAENISQCIEESRRTLIILTRSFINSEWCLMEFRTAFHQSLLEKRKHLIIVILEEIPLNELDSDMRRCLQTLTFVKANDKWFWDKLIYAMSEKRTRAAIKMDRQQPDGGNEEDGENGEKEDRQVKLVAREQGHDNPVFVEEGVFV